MAFPRWASCAVSTRAAGRGRVGGAGSGRDAAGRSEQVGEATAAASAPRGREEGAHAPGSGRGRPGMFPAQPRGACRAIGRLLHEGRTRGGRRSCILAGRGGVRAAAWPPPGDLWAASCGVPASGSSQPRPTSLRRRWPPSSKRSAKPHRTQVGPMTGCRVIGKSNRRTSRAGRNAVPARH